MEKIEFDFQAVGGQEQKLGELSRRMESLVKGQYDDLLTEIARAWDGDEADRFVYKMQSQRERMMGTADRLRQAQEALHMAAVKAKETEEKAKEIAENRTYE